MNMYNFQEKCQIILNSIILMFNDIKRVLRHVPTLSWLNL